MTPLEKRGKMDPGWNLRCKRQEVYMEIERVIENGIEIAVASGSDRRIVDGASAMELAMAVRQETGASRLALSKGLFAEDFFILSSGLAGEVLQKFVTYQIKAAVWGDYSRYTSEPLKAFLYESNCGNNFFFVSTRDEAVARLAGAR